MWSARYFAGAAAAMLALGVSGVEAQDSPVVAFNEKGLTLQTPDERVKLRIGGRFYVDAGGGRVSDDDAYDIFDKHIDNTQAWIELYPSFDKWLEGAFQYDFADNNTPLKDIALGATFDPVVVTVGNVKEPFGLEEMDSENDIAFMSRALSDAFFPGRHTGLTVAAAKDDWTVAGGLYAGEINDSIDNGGTSIGGRLTYAPVRTETDIVHLGGSLNYRDLQPNQASFSTRPESVLFGDSLVDTGSLRDAKSVSRFGLEAAWQHGPIRVQGEYSAANVDRGGGSDPYLQGGYILLAWVINGSGRPYSTELPAYGPYLGRFGAVKLEDGQRVSQGGYGVFEVAGRVSTIDLDDADVAGGRQADLTLGVNWYPDMNVRLMLDYVRAQGGNAPATGGDVNADIIQARLQIAF